MTDNSAGSVPGSASSFAYASRLDPRGLVRPASQDLIVARLTPTATASCSSVSDFASRSIRRSSGEGSGAAAVERGAR